MGYVPLRFLGCPKTSAHKSYPSSMEFTLNNIDCEGSVLFTWEWSLYDLKNHWTLNIETRTSWIHPYLFIQLGFPLTYIPTHTISLGLYCIVWKWLMYNLINNSYWMKDERERPCLLRFQQDWIAIFSPQLSYFLDLVGLRVVLL